VAKATPAPPCNPTNCGELFSQCGKITNYFARGCRCLQCRKAQRDYYKANRAKRLSYQVEYDRDHADVVQAKSRDRYYANIEANRENRLRYYRENKDRWPEWRRASGSGRASCQARRARKLEAFVEHVNPLVVFDQDGYQCQMCGVKCQRHTWPARDYATLDHIVAFVLGGKHSYANVQTLCFSCNCSKGAKERGQARRAARECPQ